MKLLNRGAAALLLLGLSLLGLGACQSLAGIEDRRYDSDAGSNDGSPSAACLKYCDLADQVCTGDNKLYASRENCLAVCALLPEGDLSAETGGNTVACRTNQLLVAQSVVEGEPGTLPDYCAKAGPGGNGTCGSNCESYCLLYAAACEGELPQLGATQYDQGTCVSKCKGLNNLPTYSADGNYDGDTLQCRLVHVSAATRLPGQHCVHAQLQAQAHAKPPGPCIDDADETDPDCNSYCQLEMTECQGANKQYENVAQCLAVCAALHVGTVDDIKENSVGCRKYHSYNALVDPDTHCPHTGPSGDGHCGPDMEPSDALTGNCESYCLLLESACPKSNAALDPSDTFEGNFASQRACQESCVGLDGAAANSGYSVSPLPEGNTLQCRLLHVSRALSKPGSECATALGGGACR